jgi:cysteine synthase
VIYNFNSLLQKYGISGKLYVWKDFQNKKFNVVRELLGDADLSGKTIVEASTGSMAKALTAFSAEKGFNVVIFGDGRLSGKLPLGATLITPPLADADTPDIIQYAALAKAYAEENGYIYLGQFDDGRHWQIYKDRLTLELNGISDTVDFYTDTVGTGATFRGFGEALRWKYPDIDLWIPCGVLVQYSKFLNDGGFTYGTTPQANDRAFFQERDEIRKTLGRDVSELLGRSYHGERYDNILNAVLLLRDNPNKTAFTTIGD